MSKELQDIVWGNRLFVNAQFTLRFVAHLTKFLKGEEELETIFAFTNAIKNQRRVKLYIELQGRVKDILLLEKKMKKGSIKKEDDSIIRYTIKSAFWYFTNLTEQYDSEN